MLTYGNTRDRILATSARNVWLRTAMFNIDLVVSHIKDADNRVADLLSRWHITMDNVQKLSHLVQAPIWIDTHIDLTLLNHDIEPMSYVSDSDAETRPLAARAFDRLWFGFRPATLASYRRMFGLFMAFLVVLDLSLH